MHLCKIVVAACLLVGLQPWYAHGATAERRQTKIDPQALAPALQALAEQWDVQVIYRSELVRGRRTGGVDGKFTLDEALTRLLTGTGLTYRYLAQGGITLVPLTRKRDAPQEKEHQLEWRPRHNACSPRNLRGALGV